MCYYGRFYNQTLPMINTRLTSIRPYYKIEAESAEESKVPPADQKKKKKTTDAKLLAIDAKEKNQSERRLKQQNQEQL